MKTIQLGKSQLTYSDMGSGLPIVFVHGVATLGELWADDLDELAADYRLVVYNRRGYGDSSTSPGNWEAHADDTIALIEALQAAPAVIVGYSAGSIIAFDLALRRPDLVAGIILLDPAFNLRRCITPGLLKALVMVRLLRRLGRDRAAAEYWLRLVSSYSTGGTAYDRKASPERKEKLLANATGIFADLASGGGNVDESRLASLTLPITLVEAKLSPSFLRRSCQRLKQLLPQASTFVLENSGHWAGLDARDELIPILRNAAHASHSAEKRAIPLTTLSQQNAIE